MAQGRGWKEPVPQTTHGDSLANCHILRPHTTGTPKKTAREGFEKEKSRSEKKKEIREVKKKKTQPNPAKANQASPKITTPF